MVLHQYTVAGMPGLLFRFSHELQARHCTGQRDDVVVNGNSDLRSILGRKVAFFEIPFDDALDGDRKSTRLNSSHSQISYAVFCLKKKKVLWLPSRIS